MGNVIDFPESETVKYSINVDTVLGVSGFFHGVEIELTPASDEFEIQINDEYVIGSREEMSKMLWAMAYMLDSDQEWVADKYPAIDK